MKYIRRCKVLGMDSDSQQTITGATGTTRPNEVKVPEDPAALPSSSLRKNEGGEGEEQEKEKMAFFWVTSWPAPW